MKALEAKRKRHRWQAEDELAEGVHYAERCRDCDLLREYGHWGRNGATMCIYVWADGKSDKRAVSGDTPHCAGVSDEGA